MAEGELSTPRDLQVEVLQGSVPYPILYSLYINDTPQTPGVYLALFADDTCIYTTDRKEGYILRKIQHGLTSMESRWERWNIKSMKIRLRPSASPIDADRSTLILH